jgi:hypothetical protein
MPRSIIRLVVLHARLEREIRRELRRPLPDLFPLACLKKRKLAVKDRIAHNTSLAA